MGILLPFAIAMGLITAAAVAYIELSSRNRLPQVSHAITAPFNKQELSPFAERVPLPPCLYKLQLPEGRFDIVDQINEKMNTDEPIRRFYINKWGAVRAIEYPLDSWDNHIYGDMVVVEPLPPGSPSKHLKKIKAITEELGHERIRRRAAERQNLRNAQPEDRRQIAAVEERTATKKAGTMDENRGRDAEQEDYDSAAEEENNGEEQI